MKEKTISAGNFIDLEVVSGLRDDLAGTLRRSTDADA